MPGDKRKYKADEQQPLLPRNNNQAEEIFGLSLLLGSTLASVGIAFFVKLCSAESIPTSEIVIAQAVTDFTLAICGCARKGVSPLGPPHARKWLLLFGAVGGLLLLVSAYCTKNMALADYTVLTQLDTVFATILAVLLLGEQFRYIDGACIVLCMTGAILVVKPPFLFGETQKLLLLPTIGSLLTALLNALIFVLVRKIRTGAYFLVFSVYFSLGSLIITFPSLRTTVAPQDLKTYIWLIMGGVCLFMNGTLVYRGMQLAPVGPASIMRINRIIVAIPLGIFVFNEYQDAMGLIGSCMIMAGTGILLYAASRR